MSVFAIKSFDNILSDMIAWISVHSPQITDFSSGSIIRSYCEATSMSVEEVYVAAYVAFRNYLALLKTDIFGLTQGSGTKANGIVVFSRDVAGNAVTIPVGVRIKTVAGLVYLTTTIGTIPLGGTSSNNVSVQAENVGIAYNVIANTVTLFDTDVDGVNSVTNPLAITGGVDIETVDAFDTRFRAYIEGLGKSNKAGLKTGALSVNGITSASVIDLFPPIDNVNCYVYVDDGSTSGISDALVEQVQAVLDGDGTTLNPGYRAGGVNVKAVKPSIVTQNIVANVYLRDSAVDHAVVGTALQLIITAYLNNLGIGKDIIFVTLGGICLSIAGVVDIVFTTPAGSVQVDNTQVIRVGTFTFNYFVVASD